MPQMPAELEDLLRDVEYALEDGDWDLALNRIIALEYAVEDRMDKESK